MNKEAEAIEGEVVSTRMVEHQDSAFERATLNSLEFRNLEGGTYKLVRVYEEDGSTDTGREIIHEWKDRVGNRYQLTRSESFVSLNVNYGSEWVIRDSWKCNKGDNE